MLQFNNAQNLRVYLEQQEQQKKEVYERLIDMAAPGSKRALMGQYKSLVSEVDRLRKQLSKLQPT